PVLSHREQEGQQLHGSLSEYFAHGVSHFDGRPVAFRGCAPRRGGAHPLRSGHTGVTGATSSTAPSSSSPSPSSSFSSSASTPPFDVVRRKPRARRRRRSWIAERAMALHSRYHAQSASSA